MNPNRPLQIQRQTQMRPPKKQAAATLRFGTAESQAESPGRSIHKFNGNVKGAQPKLAATESRPESKAGFSWNFRPRIVEYVTRLAPGRPTV
jgi:hypothetical protein